LTQAVIVARDGAAYQARLFWQKAALLLDPHGPVVKVGFESGANGFDDMWVEYDPALLDQEGHPLRREHVQCKWHVSPDSYGHASLADPAFLGATARSHLQRAIKAQRDHAPDGIGTRFRLTSNWRIDRADPLRALVNERSHTLRVGMLFGTSTDNSAMGRVRKLWREHLGVTDDELRILARTLAFSETSESLDGLREILDLHFRIVGLKRSPPNESAFIYDEVVYQWAAQGRLEFTRANFRGHCEKESLIGEPGDGRPRVYGVKSFEHATDRLEDRCSKVLNLVPDFLDRQIRPESDWKTALYPSLKAFLLEAAHESERIRLVLDAHLTLSFAAGSVLNIKSGRIIELEQRTTGRAVWAPDDLPHDPTWPGLTFCEHQGTPGEGDGIIVTVSLTHDVTGAVSRYVAASLPEVSATLDARIATAPGARAVTCGHHAFELAETLVAKIRSLRNAAPRRRVHLFMAVPGAFSFFLGQRATAIGPVTIYEYDFEGAVGASYEASLSLPVAGS
jgi:hypothetical protein